MVGPIGIIMGVATWSELNAWQWIQVILFLSSMFAPYIYAFRTNTSFTLATVFSLVLCYLVQLFGLIGYVFVNAKLAETVFWAEPSIQTNFLEWHRFFTAAWVHSGPTHLFGNVIVIGLCGVPFEQRLGRWRWLILYLIGALGGNLFWMLAHIGEYAPAVGASGAAFGLLGSYLATWPNDEIMFPLILIRPGQYGSSLYLDLAWKLY